MKDRNARAARIGAILAEKFPDPPIPLDHADAYQLLVAVILSAQCTDARVNMVTPALFERAPTAHALAAMTPDEILPYIKTCGLAPGKSRNLAAMARALVAEHGGEVPADMAALERLAGVGHKTASVVMVQAFGVPAFPVDTHIHRLAARWQLSKARNVEETEADLKALFPEDRWSRLHLQFIYFGRQYCPAVGHVPENCPICSWAMSKARAARERRGLHTARPSRKAATAGSSSKKRPAAKSTRKRT